MAAEKSFTIAACPSVKFGLINGNENYPPLITGICTHVTSVDQSECLIPSAVIYRILPRVFCSIRDRAAELQA